jgi:HK97 family phage portal protein
MAITLAQRAKIAWNVLLNRPYVQSQQKGFPFPINIHVNRSGHSEWSLVDYQAYAKEGMSQNAVVYASLKYKFDSVSQALLRAYEGHPDDAILLDDLNHPLSQLALRPNEFMSRIEFMQYCVTYLNVHGNCFVAITGINDNLHLGLYPLRPDRVRLIPSKSDDGTETVIGYAYYPQGATEETAILIAPENMAHIKFPNPYDNFEGQGYGLSPMSAAAYSIDTDNEMTRFLVRFFKNNGMMPGGIVSLPYRADPEDIAKLRDQIVESYGGAGEWGKPLVIDESGSYSSSTPSFADMALDNIDGRNVNRTTSVFGVQAMLIGLDSSSSTFDNLAQAKDDFWERVMFTELKLFEEEFRHKVDLGDNVFLRFDLSGLPAFAIDTGIQADTYVKLINSFVPPNEAKQIVGLNIPDMEGGDISYMPIGLVPVRQKEVELEQLGSGENEQDTPDNNFFEELPSEDEKRHNILNPVQYAIKAIVWDYETKDSFANAQDTVTRRFEPQFKSEAITQFELNKRAILSLYSQHKKSNHKEKKTFDYNAFKQAANRYLFGESVLSWSKGFTPHFVDVVQAGRNQWDSQLNLSAYAPDTDVKRLVSGQIEAEYWFRNYTLEFARSINTTTNQGIQAIIANGLEAGHGTDRIGNNIGLMFEQYMYNSTNSDDWEFMQERMPPYRTEMIARTETHGAMSAGNHAFFELSGVALKEWWATGDDRTRDTHLRAWNEYTEGGSPGPIGIDESFKIGGSSARHPGDRRLPLREFINCRCVELPFFADIE